MKKILLCSFVCILGICYQSFAQSANEMKEMIAGKYQIDDNGNISYVRIVEVPGISKDDLFLRAQGFFTYNYGDGESVIQIDDKEKGVIVAKGLFSDVHTGVSVISTKISAWHILRVDVKDNRARIILTLTEYDKYISGGGGSRRESSSISSEYPINKKGMSKTMMMKAFYKSHVKANETIDRLERALKGGNTSSDIENEDW